MANSINEFFAKVACDLAPLSEVFLADLGQVGAGEGDLLSHFMRLSRLL